MYVYFVCHCHPYIFLISMKSILFLVCVLFYEVSVHLLYTCVLHRLQSMFSFAKIEIAGAVT